MGGRRGSSLVPATLICLQALLCSPSAGAGPVEPNACDGNAPYPLVDTPSQILTSSQDGIVLGTSLTLTLRHSDELVRHVNGVLAGLSFQRTIEDLKGNDGEAMYVYQAELVPKAWRLNLRSGCRIFLHKDIPTILTEVLKQAGMRQGEFQNPLKAEKLPAY